MKDTLLYLLIGILIGYFLFGENNTQKQLITSDTDGHFKLNTPAERYRMGYVKDKI